jgi:CubicO group peptidase (beta-lactamase class C family)
LFGTLGSSRAPQLSTQRAGDPQLLEIAVDNLTGVRHSAGIAYITEAETRYAYVGSNARTDYELGSITKTLTGQLLADSVARGEVRPDTPVGDLLDLGDSVVASVTLAELATYRSGLGEWGDDERDAGMRRWWIEEVRGGTVHDIGLPELLDRARRDPLTTRGSFAYSNIGFALLGHALAEAAGTDYRTLLQSRLLTPLGMSGTALADSRDLNRPRGYREDGRRSQAWPLGAYGPSGGAHGTLEDVARYARALLTGDAPGLDALDRKIADPDGRGVGWGWFVRDVDGEPVAWKTGTTGGFATMIAVDRSRGAAVVVLTDTATPVDGTVWALLEGLQ